LEVIKYIPKNCAFDMGKPLEISFLLRWEPSKEIKERIGETE
jgi:hypothetical protein